ncbi:MAG: Rne/Rng family ribonuclease [Bacteroidetes bacterium]|nr:Rne/Rng family ribonuclease [Bacteroidota bacterium]
MKKEILINSTSNEIRIAITEDGKLAEFFVESPDLSRNVGDLYLGKVAKVMPGIRAAFIDLGFSQDAFLHFSDIDDSVEDYSSIIGEDADVEVEDEIEQKPPQFKGRKKFDSQRIPANIENGQDIIVQITKEPVGKKGVRVTSKVSIPGRYLVLMPFTRKIGISKKIYNYREKRRLRRLLRSMMTDEYGVIVRTVAAGQDESLIKEDLKELISKWNKIQNRIKTTTAPAILYKDVSTTSSVIRDLFRDDVTKVIIDTKKLYKEIKNYIDITSPEFSEKIEYYSIAQPLFDAYNIEKQINETMNKKVWLKNSGHIVIETTEAMTVVDVNSGKYAKSQDQESNSLKMNNEAGREIIRQLRLRDIGGIIVIDFIDLYEEENRKKLFEEIKKEFKKDRAKVTILPMSEFGIVQITRQRVRQAIIQRVSDVCPMCNGKGRVQSRTSYITEIERWLQRYKGASSSRFLKLKVNPLIEPYLTCGVFNNLLKFKIKYFLSITLETDERLALDEFRFYSRKTNADITQEFSY